MSYHSMFAPVHILTFTPSYYPNSHLWFSFGTAKLLSSNTIRTQIMLISIYIYFDIKAVIWRMLIGWQGFEFRKGTGSLFTACPQSRQSTHKADLLNDREGRPKFEADRTCCWCNALKFTEASFLSDELSQVWYSCNLNLTHVTPRIFTFIGLEK
jgi:hypothetical protein